jgi:hypothetical protein
MRWMTLVKYEVLTPSSRAAAESGRVSDLVEI